MRSFLIHISSLLLLTLVLLVTGFFMFERTNHQELWSQLLTLTSCFSVITLISLIIFNRGISRDSRSQTFHSFVSISLKFLLELFLALIWFIVIKKTETESVLMFFVLYLSFSFILIFLILKTLKTKSL